MNTTRISFPVHFPPFLESVSWIVVALVVGVVGLGLNLLFKK